MNSKKKMPIHEIFGPTIQGEGMVIGRKTMFVRTGGCDYSCSWCDSAFTWNGEQKAQMLTAQDVYDQLICLGTNDNQGDLNFNHVTISGGNPALIGEPMSELISMLHEKGIEIGLETQGTFWKEWMNDVDDLTISPKPPSSGMVTDWAKLHRIVDELDTKSLVFDRPPTHSFKVVIFDDEDFDFAKEVYRRFKPKVFYVSVGNEDAKEEGNISGRLLDKLEWLWDKVLAEPEANNWRPFPQLHTLVWANKRGV